VLGFAPGPSQCQNNNGTCRRSMCQPLCENQTDWSCCLDAKWMEKFINTDFSLLLLTFSHPPLPFRKMEKIFQLSRALGFLPIRKSDRSFKEKNKHIYGNNLATFPVLIFWHTFNREICKWRGFLLNWSWASQSFQYSRNCCPCCLAFWM